MNSKNEETIAQTDSKASKLAITGLVLGILSALGLYELFAIAPILAITFSAIGLNNVKKLKQRGKGIAIGGLILGVLFTMQFFIKLIPKIISKYNYSQSTQLDINNYLGTWIVNHGGLKFIIIINSDNTFDFSEEVVGEENPQSYISCSGIYEEYNGNLFLTITNYHYNSNNPDGFDNSMQKLMINKEFYFKLNDNLNSCVVEEGYLRRCSWYLHIL